MKLDLPEMEPTRWTLPHPDLGDFIIEQKDDAFVVYNHCGLPLAKFDSVLSARNAIQAVIPTCIKVLAARQELQELELTSYKIFTETAVR